MSKFIKKKQQWRKNHYCT